MDEEALEVEVVVVETGIQQIEMTRLREKNINNHSNNRNLVKMIEVPVEEVVEVEAVQVATRRLHLNNMNLGYHHIEELHHQLNKLHKTRSVYES